MYGENLGCSPAGRVAYGQLGFIPLVAIPAAVETASTAWNAISSIFGSSDPARDGARKARVDTAYNAAMAGDVSAETCLREMAQGVSTGPNDSRSCALGSQVAAEYAKRRYGTFLQAKAAGQVQTGGVLGKLTGSPMLLGALGLGLVFVLMKGSRRRV